MGIRFCPQYWVMILAAILHHRNSKPVACKDGGVVVRTIFRAAAAQFYRALAGNGSFRHKPTGRRSLDDLRDGEIVFAN
uniref:Putative secreted protein n=1 Tax=Anopheles darlingi TaxID=43151 RepID=A0A2M4DP11_ANODA